MTAGLVDFHCHLDLYPNYPACIRECEEAGVFTLTVTTTPKAWPRNNELAAGTRYVRAALGLHPQLVAERAGEIAYWEELLPRTRYVGEVGLDGGPRFFRSLEKQREVFARVLSLCARAGDKILTVHSLRSANAVLDMIETHLPPGKGRVVLHWFTGSNSEARRAVDLGCYFSINRDMLVGDKRRNLVATLPRNRLLTETDGPFTSVNDRPSRPTDVGLVLEDLAKLHGSSVQEARALILANLKCLLETSHG